MHSNTAKTLSSSKRNSKNVSQALENSISCCNNKQNEFKLEENFHQMKKLPRLSLFESDLLKQTQNLNLLDHGLSQQNHFFNENKIIDLTKKVHGLNLSNFMKHQSNHEANDITIKEIPIEYNSTRKANQEKKSTNLSTFEPSQATLFSTEYSELDNQNFFNDKNKYLIKESFYY